MRDKVLDLKAKYEDALRKEFFLGAAIASIPACGPRERTAALLRVLPGLHQV